MVRTSKGCEDVRYTTSRPMQNAPLNCCDLFAGLRRGGQRTADQTARGLGGLPKRGGVPEAA